MKDWPPSNFPILIALMLLAATIVTLSMGGEKLAEEFAIYAYYFLAIGVAIRFLEFALPDDAQKKLGQAKMKISGYIEQHIPESNGLAIPDADDILMWLYSRAPRLYWAMIETKRKISGYVKQFTLELIKMTVQKMGDLTKWLYVTIPQLYWAVTKAKVRISGYLKQGVPDLNRNIGEIFYKPYRKRTRLPETKFQKTIAMISDTSRNVAIFLSVFLLISLVYGLVIDWWYVVRYLHNLVLIIIGFSAIHFLIRMSLIE